MHVHFYKCITFTADSEKLDCGPGAIYAGFPSSQGCLVGGQSYSNFLASTVCWCSIAATKLDVCLPSIKAPTPACAAVQ